MRFYSSESAFYENNVSDLVLLCKQIAFARHLGRSGCPAANRWHAKTDKNC